MRALAERLREGLAALPGVTVRDRGGEKCAIVTFDAKTRRALEIRDALRGRSINVSVTTVASTRLDMESRGLEEMVRASVHCYNTEDEVERFCRELATLL